MRHRLVLLSALLATAPLTARAQFQDQYTHVSGGNVLMAAPMRSRVSVQTPSGDILYLSGDGGAFDLQGFRLHKVSSTGSWITTYSDPGSFTDPDIAPLAMTLDFDGLHVIIVGLQDEPVGPEILAVLKLRISDGAVIWSKLVESTGAFVLLGPWDGAVIARHPGSQTFLIFGNDFLDTPSGARRKLAGFALDTNGNLAWSRLYVEANAQFGERLHSRPTDIAVAGNFAFVATETDNEASSRIGLFRVNATTGEFVNMRLYSDPENRKLFNPRIDVVTGVNRRIAMTFDEFDGPPWVALTANNGNVLWSQRITSATTGGGIFRNSLLPNRLDTFVGEADKAGIVSFGLVGGAILDEHYMALLRGDEDIVSMDRSQDESYILSLEQRDPIDLLAAGLGYIFGDDSTDTLNTFTLVLTDTPANPFACEIDGTTTVAAHALDKLDLDYINDDWAQLEDFESGTTVNTTMSAAPCP
jgi:hypothetical protein